MTLDSTIVCMTNVVKRIRNAHLLGYYLLIPKFQYKVKIDGTQLPSNGIVHQNFGVFEETPSECELLNFLTMLIC